MRLAAYFELARPGNAAMAAVATLAGGLAVGVEPPGWARILVACIAALFGVAGGNALNDALDARVDVRAHGRRPVARGEISSRHAVEFACACFGAAFGAALLANIWVLLLALVLTVLLAAYESGLKQRGLVGNLVVSLVVAATFLLGALATAPPTTFWGWVPAADAAATLRRLPVWMALVAFLANTARELWKDLEDAVADRGERWTFPHRHGATATHVTATLCLSVAVPLTFVPVLRGWFGWREWGLLAPALGFFVVAVILRSPRRSSLAVKLGMALAVTAFVILGLI